jgi:hypothetical protein
MLHFAINCQRAYLAPGGSGRMLRNPEVIHVSESANRRSDLGEAAGLLGEKAGWHFRAARAPHGDISTESAVLPWSGQAGRRDSGASAGFFAFFT